MRQALLMSFTISEVTYDLPLQAMSARHYRYATDMGV
jgi:hypothetical protein